jgi:SulP family sulfate permease
MSLLPLPESFSIKQKLLPFFNWTPMVDRGTLKADFWAALTGALVVLPQGVAYATIAGMPPQYGLYAGMIPAIVAALFGSSWHLVSGPTVAGSLVMASALSQLAEPTSVQYVMYALTLTALVGVLELTMGLFRLGTLVNFISHSVIVGFTAAAGVLIGANQIKNFFDLPIPRESNFIGVLEYLFTHLGDISWPPAVVGATTILTAIAFRRYFPRFPYMIAAILAASAVGVLLNEVVSPGAVKMVGALPPGLPPLSAPSFNPETWQTLASITLAMTLFALTEAMSISRALALRSGQHIDASQEFIGQGLSNVAGAFFSGYVATGSFNRSALNYAVGARTPVAAMLAGLLLMFVVVLVAPFAAYLPNATMAGVLFLVAWGLWDHHHITQIIKASKSETAVLAVTFFSALLLKLDFAIFTGVILSLVLYLRNTSNPHIHLRVPNPEASNRKFTDARPDLPECPQARLIRIDGSLFFGAINAFQEALLEYEKANPDCKRLAIIMQAVNFVDIAGAEALIQVAQRYRDRGGALYLIRPKKRVVDFLARGGYLEKIGNDNIFFSKTQALHTVFASLDRNICRTCDRHVFLECDNWRKQGAESDASYDALSPHGSREPVPEAK